MNSTPRDLLGRAPGTSGLTELRSGLRKAYDEAFESSGGSRPEYQELLAWFDEVDLAALGDELKRRLRQRGVTFGAAPDGIFALDPVPRVLSAREWDELAAGISQRVRALEHFAPDAYSDKEVVDAGVVPQHVVA